MADFLTTHGVAFSLENIIRHAEKQIILLSPYLNISRILFDRLKEADRRNVSISIVFRKNELNKNEFDKINSLKNLKLYDCNNLHAKCYVNEETAVISSMNLYEFSEKNNREMGALFDKVKNKDAYNHIIQEISEIKRSSTWINKEDHAERKDVVTEKLDLDKKETEVLKAFAIYFGIGVTKISWDSDLSEIGFKGFGYGHFYEDDIDDVEDEEFDHDHEENLEEFIWEVEQVFRVSISKKHIYHCKSIKDFYEEVSKIQTEQIKSVGEPYGYCIRTGGIIALNMKAPLSKSAYRSWAKYKNVNYKEEYCHKCGEKAKTTIKTPLCKKCK